MLLTFIQICAILPYMDTSVLRKAGLTESQAKGYLALIEYGATTPTKLAELTGETRTNAYAIAEKLVEFGLAEKLTDRTKTAYRPTNPTNLRKLLLDQQRQLKAANEAITGVLPSLVSRFNLTSDQPGVLTLEGLPGIHTLYDDILKTNLPLSIITSNFDRVEAEISRTIDEQINRQTKAGITTRALYSQSEAPNIANVQQLASVGIETRIANIESPAQMIIYGQHVAYSGFRGGMITMLITHSDIARTMQTVFDALWDKADKPR